MSPKTIGFYSHVQELWQNNANREVRTGCLKIQTNHKVKNKTGMLLEHFITVYTHTFSKNCSVLYGSLHWICKHNFHFLKIELKE